MPKRRQKGSGGPYRVEFTEDICGHPSGEVMFGRCSACGAPRDIDYVNEPGRQHMRLVCTANEGHAHA